MVKIANRTREIRPSGMKRGACGDVSYSDFISHLAARAVFLSRLTLSQAFVRNVGTCRFDVKGEIQVEIPQE